MAIDHEDVLVRLGAVEESSKQAHKRLNELHELIEGVQALASSVAGMQEQLVTIQGDVNSLKEKPVKRLEVIINTVITTVIGGALGYLISMVIQGGTGV